MASNPEHDSLEPLWIIVQLEIRYLQLTVYIYDWDRVIGKTCEGGFPHKQAHSRLTSMCSMIKIRPEHIQSFAI